MRVRQDFIISPFVLPIFSVGTQLVGTFNNVGGDPHGNNLTVHAAIGPNFTPTTALVAEDRFGLAFNLSVIDSLFPPPSEVLAVLQYGFLGNPVAGDSIDIPLFLNITNSVPVLEPSSILLFGTGLASLLGVGWRRKTSSAIWGR